MDLISWEALGVVLVGLASGVLSGMFGIGGAVLTTPGIRALGATPIEAVGSTIPAILPSAVSGTIRYARAGLVDWRVGLVCGASGSLLAVAGAWVADLVGGRSLMVVTAMLLAWTGWSMVRPPRSPASEEHTGEDGAGADAGETEPGVGELVAVGAAAGFVAGVLGVGGGVVMIPAFTRVLRLPVKTAVASSLVAVAIFSVPALLSHALLDHIEWTFALALVIGVVPGAQFGARLTIGSSEATMRRLAGAFFLVLAAAYGVGEVAALVAGS